MPVDVEHLWPEPRGLSGAVHYRSCAAKGGRATALRCMSRPLLFSKVPELLWALEAVRSIRATRPSRKLGGKSGACLSTRAAAGVHRTAPIAAALVHAYPGDAMPQLGDLPETPLPVVCSQHDCLAEICGGPHRVVRTDLGDEILAPSEGPIGEPLDQ